MSNPLVYALVVVVIVAVVAYLLGIAIRYVKGYLNKGYDLIIQFDSDVLSTMMQNQKFKELAKWTTYGKNGVRGFSKFYKEQMEDILTNEFHLNKDVFKVVKGNVGIYFPVFK